MGEVFDMDRNVKNDLKEPLDGSDSQNGKLIGHGNGISKEDDDDETKLLLLPSKGGLSKKSGKPRLKVQWNDRNGDKLAEVLEFQPRYYQILFLSDSVLKCLGEQRLIFFVVYIYNIYICFVYVL